MPDSQQKIFLQSAAPNYAASREFYKKLNFVERYHQGRISIFSDNVMDILVNGTTAARPGYVLYTTELEAKRASMAKELELFETNGGFVTADPNGVRFYLYPWELHPEISGLPPEESSMCGNNYGTAIETTRFQESLNFWQAMGYTAKNEITEKTQYVTMSNIYGPAITFFKPGNCPHAFYNPSITYFNGKEGNPIVIANLREAGIVPVEDIIIFNDAGEVDNIIISDPGGLHSFIYNDG